MGLEDFEKELAAEQTKRTERKDDEDGERRKHRSRYHHKSSRHHESRDGHRHERKRSRDGRHRDRERDDRHRSKRVRSRSPRPDAGEEDDEWVEKEAMTAPPTENILDERDQDQADTNAQRDSWMQAPSALDVDHVQKSRARALPKSQFVSAKEDHERKVHQNEIDQLARDFDDDGYDDPAVRDEPAQHEVTYTFGDSGSQWRMSKLKNVYREARDSERSVEEVALERYGDLRDFDDAREEEREMDRRVRYGKDYVGLDKPSGEFFQQRKMKAGLRREHHNDQLSTSTAQGETIAELPPPSTTLPLDQTSLNKLKAKMLKAQLRKDPSAAALEAEYTAAIAASANAVQPDTIVLSQMDNRLLAARGNEVTAVTNKRGQTRGTVVENSDMSIEDMVRAERRSRGTQSANEGLLLANRIASDAKFSNDLEYMDDNAGRLATRGAKSDAALRSAAVGDFQRTQAALDACPLCHHEDRGEPPAAPLVSLGTRTFLTLATEPELSPLGAVIVPVQHRGCLLECDDDEWEEIRNFMKSLTRMYAGMGRGVVFYENAARHGGPGKRFHAAMVAVPLGFDLVDAAPGFFKEAILAADEEWSQHKKVIDTAALARERWGKQAFRRALVKEMPYFHVWFTLDGGLGHIVEDERRWPRGDLFAREVIGGMLDRAPETIKKQGRWTRRDHRLEGFRKKWDKYDWTKVLTDAAM